MTPLLPNIIVPGFILSVSVENFTSARGLLELNWARRLLETLRSRVLVSSVKLRTSRSHMSSAMPSVFRFTFVRLEHAVEVSDYLFKFGFRVQKAGGWGGGGVQSDLENCA